ncbi:hypothetical protein [Paenibacillus faecalis]|uniref:hypothetical protein n=1 Tax=Paenibacillus faecalis TaxID=2079532 RepID=UPI000D1050A0|nr:hypothetical protein [Paenibacillus faecalis]
MSLGLILASSNKIMIGADSRLSMTMNGLNYAAGTARKIEQIDNSVVFSSGHGVVSRRIMDSFKSCSAKTVDNLKLIMIEEMNKYLEESKNFNFSEEYDFKKKLVADMTYCCFENNLPVIYNICSRTNYKVIRETCTNEESAFAAVGVQVEEAVSLAKQLRNKLSPLELYPEVYSRLANEQVGGQLTVYTLTNGKVIHNLTCPILDRKPIRRYEEQFNLTNEDGFFIDKNVNGTMDRVVWLDLDGNLNAKSGHFKDSFITDGQIVGATLKIGSGNHVFKADYNGIYLGSENFNDAPFRVGLDGILYAKSAHLKDSFITDGELVGGSLRIGSGDRVLHVNKDGIYLGNDNPNLASFWVTPEGKLYLRGPNGQLFINTEDGFADFNGMDVRGIGAIDAELLAANMLSVQDGIISNLTAGRLSTLTNAALNNWSNYIRIEGNSTAYITGKVKPGSEVHKTLSDGRPLYWVSSEKKGLMTVEPTAWPVMVYDMEEKEKMKFYFEGDGQEAYPIIDMGEGDLRGYGKGSIIKPKGSFDLVYSNSNYGRERSLKLHDDGISVISENGQFIAKSKDFNFIVDQGEYKIGLSNGTIFEVSPTGVNMDIQGNINIKATGVVTINGQQIKLN